MSIDPEHFYSDGVDTRKMSSSSSHLPDRATAGTEPVADPRTRVRIE